VAAHTSNPTPCEDLGVPPRLMTMSRSARIQRETSETDVDLELSLDGSGQADVQTGVGFLAHMLTLLA
jgi:hypothetical protein